MVFQGMQMELKQTKVEKISKSMAASVVTTFQSAPIFSKTVLKKLPYEGKTDQH